VFVNFGLLLGNIFFIFLAPLWWCSCLATFMEDFLW
jgi:hypothetical protein